jgi:hypothetical protein
MLKNIKKKEVRKILDLRMGNGKWENLNTANEVNSKNINVDKILHDESVQFLITSYIGMPYENVSLMYPMKMDKVQADNNVFINNISNVFENVRYYKNESDSTMLSLNGLKDDVSRGFDSMMELGSVDNFLIDFFKIGFQKRSFAQKFNEKVEVFEYVLKGDTEQRDCDKLINYIDDHMDNTENNYFYLPLEGWKIDEFSDNGYFNNLSLHYDKIFICGSGEEWTSSSAIFVH